MKDKKLRLYIKRVLFCGLFLAVFFAVLWLLFGGIYGRLALGTIILLPLARLATEIFGFWKEGQKGFALISVVMLFILAVEYFILGK